MPSLFETSRDPDMETGLDDPLKANFDDDSDDDNDEQQPRRQSRGSAQPEVRQHLLQAAGRSSSNSNGGGGDGEEAFDDFLEAEAEAEAEAESGRRRRSTTRVLGLLALSLASLLLMGKHWLGRMEILKSEVPADRLDRFHYQRQRYLLEKAHEGHADDKKDANKTTPSKSMDQKDHASAGGLGSEPSLGYDELLKRASDWAQELAQGGMRQASVHLHYSMPWAGAAPGASNSVAWFHKLVPKRSADDTYFAVQGTHIGYFGLQQIRDFPRFEGKVIFSAWDDEGSDSPAKIFECGTNTVCTRFSGEGTGAKAYIHFSNWKLDRPYYFVTTAQESPSSSHHAIYSGYFHAEELGGWVLVARIEAYVGGKGWPIKSPYSFTEQWTARDYDSERWQLLGPTYMQFGDGVDPIAGTTLQNWKQVRQAYFTHTSASGENTMTSKGNVTGDQWGLGMGGSATMTTSGTTLTVDEDSTYPESMKSFTSIEAADRPGGCLGGTCSERQIIGFVTEAFSSSNLPITIIVSLMLSIVIGLVVLLCCNC